MFIPFEICIINWAKLNVAESEYEKMKQGVLLIKVDSKWYLPFPRGNIRVTAEDVGNEAEASDVEVYDSEPDDKRERR